MPRRAVTIALAAAVLLTAGCPSGHDTHREPLLYDCEDDKQFGVIFDSDRETVDVVLDKEDLLLARVMSASGTRYTDGRVTLFTKGHEARIEIDGVSAYEGCHAAPPKD